MKYAMMISLKVTIEIPDEEAPVEEELGIIAEELEADLDLFIEDYTNPHYPASSINLTRV